MVNVPSVPEIITVNSEALQTQIRDLLPSQNGFGSELQASNVIMPIIDLTAAAEGTTTPISMQQALAFGSQTAFSAANSTDVIENSPGFYRIFGNSSQRNIAGSGNVSTSLTMTDGATVKTIWSQVMAPISGGSSPQQSITVNFDLIVFLAAGESISAVSDNVNSHIIGSSRQVADGSGTLTNPNGFPL